MLTDHQKAIVKSTIPLLESAGPALTEHFYRRMFAHNPELQHIFNLSNQHSGRQQLALFEAVAAYAKNIDNLEALLPAVERIAHKHTSFDIQPEHYGIVGHNLIETLRELAPDAFTAEVEDAWAAAYGVLADVFIQREAALYQVSEQSPGGWNGRRRFVLTEKTQESEQVTSFVLTPVDNNPVIDYQPGQYIGIEVEPSGSEYREIRQYSLSDRPDGTRYRISVKRERARDDSGKDGVVSNYLHDHVHVGDSVDLHPPAGDFFLMDRQRPVVLISAGVGLTPMQAMLESLSQQQYAQPVTYLHACESVAEHSFAERVAYLCDTHCWAVHTWYQTSDRTLDEAVYHQGRMTLSIPPIELPIETGDFYLCGPIGFMASVKQQLLVQGASEDRIHYEAFGPHRDV